jgi:hypothetical protein
MCMHAEEHILTFLTLNINFGISPPEAITLKRLWSYGMIDVLLVIIIPTSVGRRGIPKCPLVRDTFLFRLAIGIPLKLAVP